MMNLDKPFKTDNYFQGWFLKQQTKEEIISFIPAFHKEKSGNLLFSLQIITSTDSYYLELPLKEFRYNRKSFFLKIGNNYFSKYGCNLNIKTEDLQIQGRLWYHSLTPPVYDIMGPFRFVPFMECRHHVESLQHRVDGKLKINKKELLFVNDTGYIEGDSGSSFPSRYVWTQCSQNKNCIMLSVAEIPFCFGSFIGCIGSLYLDGIEYRIATYCGAKMLHISNKKVVLKQRELTISAELIEGNEQLLRAPHLGNMKRNIHESVAAKVRYRCKFNRKIIFDFITNQGSFESNWNE